MIQERSSMTLSSEARNKACYWIMKFCLTPTTLIRENLFHPALSYVKSRPWNIKSIKLNLCSCHSISLLAFYSWISEKVQRDVKIINFHPAGIITSVSSAQTEKNIFNLYSSCYFEKMQLKTESKRLFQSNFSQKIQLHK